MTVVDVSNDALLAVSEDLPYCTSNDLYGHCVDISGENGGVIDAGVPHYKKGLILGDSGGVESTVSLWGKEIGVITGSRPYIHDLILDDSLKTYLDGELVRGLSFYIMTREQLFDGLIPIKVIPLHYGTLRATYSPGTPCSLVLR